MRRMKRNVGLLLAVLVAAAAAAAAQPRGARLLVLNKEDATMVVVNPESGTVLATVPTGQGPHELVASADPALRTASAEHGTLTVPARSVAVFVAALP